MARLDRLGPAKEIAQIGSAIGREFSYSLVSALVGRSDGALRHALEQLEDSELVICHGDPPDAVYIFKHALVQEVAYESLLKSRRNLLHAEIARALENRFHNLVDSQPEIIARHFTEAGMVDRAIDYWLKAGNLALSRSANAEAVKHLQRGIEAHRIAAAVGETLSPRARSLPRAGPRNGCDRGRCRSGDLAGVLPGARAVGQRGLADGADDGALGRLSRAKRAGRASPRSRRGAAISRVGGRQRASRSVGARQPLHGPDAQLHGRVRRWRRRSSSARSRFVPPTRTRLRPIDGSAPTTR